MRVSRWPWVGVAAVSTGLLIAASLLVALTLVPASPGVIALGLMTFPLVGGLIVLRRPGNRIGELLTQSGFWFAVATFSLAYFWLSLETGPLPGAEAAGWVTVWAYWPAAAAMGVLLTSFPSGKVVSRWMRVATRVMVVVVAVLTVVAMILPEPVHDMFLDDEIVNPWALLEWTPSPGVGNPILPYIFTVFFVLALVDLARRWRASHDDERLQIRWFGLGLAALVALIVTGWVSGSDFLFVAFWTGFGILPITIGIAVTHYRLYAIDRLISRTVSYTVVAGMLGAIFATIAIGLPQLLGLTRAPPLLVAAATLAAAALFNPLRLRVQDRVDRRFNRARYDAQQEVELFAERLRTGMELEDLTDEVLSVVDKTLQPARSSVWVRTEESS